MSQKTMVFFVTVREHYSRKRRKYSHADVDVDSLQNFFFANDFLRLEIFLRTAETGMWISVLTDQLKLTAVMH